MQVTWVEHSEYDESAVHPLFKPLVRSGLGFGAQRWLASLQRQCEGMAMHMPSNMPSEEHTGFSLLFYRPFTSMFIMVNLSSNT